MNTKYVALVLVAVSGTAASAAPVAPGRLVAPKQALPSSKKVATANTNKSGPRVVDTWDGTNAYANAGIDHAVYALSLTNASYTKLPGSIQTNTNGFQCVELALRYFNYRKGIPVASWGWIDKATTMCAHQARGVTKTSHPVAGDLVVLKAWDNDPNILTEGAGHVAIVMGVSGDTIFTFNQNWDNDKTARAKVSQKRDVLCSLHAAETFRVR